MTPEQTALVAAAEWLEQILRIKAGVHSEHVCSGVCDWCKATREAADTLALLRAALEQSQKTWRVIETAPKDGTPIHIWAESLIDEDFNPSGCVDGYWQDDDGWIGAIWDGQFDEWRAMAVTPTHWKPKEGPHGTSTKQR